MTGSILRIFPFFLMSLAAYATSDCSEVRLDQGKGSVVGIPVTDQGAHGTCASHAAHVQFSAILNQEDPTRQRLVSPDYIAASKMKTIAKDHAGESFKSIQEGWIDGAVPLKIMQELLAAGACEKSYFEKKYSLDTIDKKFKSFLQLMAIEKNRKLLTSMGSERRIENSLDHMSDYYSAIRLENRSVRDALRNEYSHRAAVAEECKLSQINAKTAQALSGLLDAGKWVEYLDLLEKLNFPCDGHRLKASPLWEAKTLAYRKPDDRGAVFSEIDRYLSVDGLPPIIGYCVSFLQGGIGPDERIDRPNSGYLEGCGGHASAIIGRRKSTSGECEYLVRNSWGDMDSFLKRLVMWDVDVEQSKDSQVSGNFWIKKSDLDRVLLNVTVSRKGAPGANKKDKSLKSLLEQSLKNEASPK